MRKSEYGTTNLAKIGRGHTLFGANEDFDGKDFLFAVSCNFLLGNCFLGFLDISGVERCEVGRLLQGVLGQIACYS